MNKIKFFTLSLLYGFLLSILWSYTVHATELTKEGTLIKQGSDWSVEGFGSVETKDNTVIVKDSFYKSMSEKFVKAQVGGGTGARFEGLDILKDAGIDYSFSGHDDLVIWFMKDKKIISLNEVPDLDAKVTMFANFADGKTTQTQASNTSAEAANITAPAPAPKSKGGGCQSTGCTWPMLALVMIWLIIGKLNEKNRRHC